jgi:AcrR family transcriptional regulator
VPPAAPVAPAKIPDERRQRILAATVDVVREKGFAGVRVADIADAAAVSPGLVLYHFGSLAGVLTEALTWLEDSYYGDVESTVDIAADPVQGLRSMADLGAGVVDGWKLWLELWVRALRDDKAREARDSLDRRWRSAIEGAVTAGTAAGIFRPSDVAATTLRLASLMDGLAVLLALGDLEPRRFRDLWLGAAALELGVDPAVLVGAGDPATR